MEAMREMGLLTERIQAVQFELDKLKGVEVAPLPLLDGKSLADAGLQPGPLFKRLLDAVYDAQLEGRIRTPQEALAMALRLAGETKG